MSYHNTVPEEGDQLKEYLEKAKGQQQKISAIINTFKRPFSAKDIFNAYPDNILMTSVRRSISNLKKEDDCNFVATGKRVLGLYGRSEKQYILRSLIN